MNLKHGTRLQGGRYVVGDVLGQGGFGITYMGVQTTLDAQVAIKEFFMKDLHNRDEETSQVSVGSVGSRELVERFREKFIKEARNIFRLRHKHIVSVIDVFEENGTAYYVMEFCSGGSLAGKVRDGALPEQQAVRYIRQVASALAFVHENKMMHLDVKPANILLDAKDNAVLIDFGLAKQYDDAGSQTSTTPVGISHGYAPMEQYKKGGVSSFSPTVDIYSLGATLYKLVTGMTPPEANDLFTDGLPQLPSHLSAPVCRAIEAAMQPRYKDRPQSIDEFLKILDGEDAVAAAADNGETVVPVEEKTQVVEEVAAVEVAVEPKANEPLPPAGDDSVKNKGGNEPPSKKSKTPWIIALLLLLVCAAGAYFLLGDNSDETAEQQRINSIISTPRRDKGLLCIAAVDKNSRKRVYFTGDEWESLSNDVQSKYAQLGVSIRQNGHEFIIAAKDCGGGKRYTFGGYGTDFEGVKNYDWHALHSTFIHTGKSDTEKIIAQTRGITDEYDIEGAPAAEAAWSYKANRYDNLQWYLPSHSELLMIYENKDEINEFLHNYFTDAMPIEEWYWSSTEYDDECCWYDTMSNLASDTVGTYKHTTFRVRPVAK